MVEAEAHLLRALELRPGTLLPIKPYFKLPAFLKLTFRCMIRSRGRDTGRDARRAVGSRSH